MNRFVTKKKKTSARSGDANCASLSSDVRPVLRNKLIQIFIITGKVI